MQLAPFIPVLFDEAAIAWVQRLLGLGWPLPWRIISVLGTSWGMIFAVGVAFWLWGRRPAYALLAVIAVDGAAKALLNHLIHVPRPDGPAIVKYEQVDIGSFPSGHVATAASMWGYLSAAGHVPRLISVAVIGAVCAARLYLGVHYVGDLLGGILLGLLSVWIVRRAWPRVSGHLARLPSSAYVGAAALAVAAVIVAASVFLGANPYRWRAAGMVAGLAVALPLEYRLVRYRPGGGRAGRRIAKVAIGAGGLAAAAVLDQLTGERWNILGLTSTFTGAVWAAFVAPLIFVKAGWSETEEPVRPAGRAARAGDL